MQCPLVKSWDLRGLWWLCWPGWCPTLTPGPATRKLLRSSENELWSRKPDSYGALNKIHLNGCPGGGCKGHWSQPRGKKNSQGSNLEVTGLFCVGEANGCRVTKTQYSGAGSGNCSCFTCELICCLLIWTVCLRVRCLVQLSAFCLYL